MTELLSAVTADENLPRIVSAHELPRLAQTILQETAAIDGFDDLESLGLNQLREFNQPNGDTTVFGTYTRPTDGQVAERDTILFDIDSDDTVTGIGKIQYFDSFKGMESVVGVPFVGFTKTVGSLERQGLAERRLLTMDLIARRAYGKALHSGTYQVEAIKPLWDKLVGRGLAVKQPSSSDFQYRFK